MFQARRQVHVSLDLSKAFDRVPHQMLFAVCLFFGMPRFVLGLIRVRLQKLYFRWKLQGWISGPNYLSRGIIQGCAMSCLLFNLIMAPLLWRAQACPLASPLSAHADDLYTFGEDQHSVVRTYDLVEDYVNHLGIPLQTAKSQVLVVADTINEPITLGGTELSPASEIRVLGQDHALRFTAMGTTTVAERLRMFYQRLSNIGALKVGYAITRKLVQTMAISVLTYAPWQLPALNIPVSTRARVVQTLFPSLAAHRAVEVVLHVYVPGHTLDPPMVLLYRFVVCWAKLVRQRPELLDVEWPCIASRMGPRTLFYESLQELGITLKPNLEVESCDGKTHTLRPPLADQAYQVWLHRWRALLRRGLWSQLADRRPAYQAILPDVDRAASRLLFDLMDLPYWRHHLVAVASAATINGHSKAHFGHQSSECPWCQAEDETQEHRLWACPHWQDCRDLWLQAEHFDDIIDPLLLPRALCLFGLVPLGTDVAVSHILRIQAMLLTIELSAAREECASQKLAQHVMPHPHMMGRWLASPTVRKLRLEPDDLPHAGARDLDHDDLQQPIVIGEHQLEPVDPTRCRCIRCAKEYALSSVYLYSTCPCNIEGGQRQRGCRCKRAVRTQMQWTIPRHGVAGHDFIVRREGQKIECKKCGAAWRWRQRHTLATARCTHTPSLEEARRQQIDDQLPISRNGHIPRVHAEFNCLECLRCGFLTGSLAIRGFDRHPCNDGILIPRQHRQVFVPVLSHGRFTARCRMCPYEVPWRRRSAMRHHRC